MVARPLPYTSFADVSWKFSLALSCELHASADQFALIEYFQVASIWRSENAGPVSTLRSVVARPQQPPPPTPINEP